MKRIVIAALLSVLGGAVLPSPANATPEGTSVVQEVEKNHIRGKVVDESGEPLPGVHVKFVGAQVAVVITNEQGVFDAVSAKSETDVEFSYIGFHTLRRKLKAGVFHTIKLREDVGALGEVVVTGIVTKAKSSYTGAQVTVKKDELLSMGTRNVIESLASVVPGLTITENVSMGSDPNARPDFNIRGRSTFTGTANMPVFVVDGAEVGYDYVYDMDMNDIETVTVLKDASATALYGAKAAAGVIVITTKTLGEGRLRFNYSGTYRLSMPDLSDYNLLNSAQKLEYERLAGLYTASSRFLNPIERQYELDQEYDRINKLVLSGIDTDWMSKPLRNGLTQNHSISVDGGDKATRYNLGMRYQGEEGVMKGSSRERISGIFKFSYNLKDKLFFSNTLTISLVEGEASPYGDFSRFVNANPYESPYNPDGSLRTVLTWDQENPLYEANTGSFSRTNQFNVLNTTSIKYWFNRELRLDADVSFSRTKDGTDAFVSPLAYRELRVADAADRGSYTESNLKGYKYSGRLVMTYNKELGRFFFNTSLGGNIEKNSSENTSYTSRGFYTSTLDHPSFAVRYPSGGRPSGRHDLSTLAGAFLNVNVTYNNRYFLDLIYRYEGSSRFGRNQRFAPFWSVGGGWNLQNEEFIKRLKVVSLLKLRASAGYVGNISFDPSQALTTYSYARGLDYGKGIGALSLGIGNPDLKWERTLNLNAGVDATLFKGRLDLSLDYYLKNTDNLLLDVTKAPSVGVLSAKENLGAIENRGVELRMRVTPIRTEHLDWSISLTMSSNRNKIKRISNALELMNIANRDSSNTTTPLPIYEEGESMSALKVVPSAGIDPATGQEVYIKRDGSYTFVYDARDKVTFGTTEPKLQGSINSYLTYKNWTFNASFGYSLGGVTYNQTLVTRVEGSDPQRNADERVLNDRWRQPGDVALYKNIALRETPQQTSRFVRVNNYLSLNTLSVAYDFSPELLNSIGVKRLRLELLTKDLFYLTSIKRERGLSYPFAHSVEMSLRFSI